MFNLYEQRVGERTAFAREQLKKNFDFTKDESYNYQREKAPWPKTSAELDDLWRQRVKNDWLRLKLAGKKDADIRNMLDKRYATYLDRIHQLNSEDVFQTFMNAYAMSIDPHTNYLGPRSAENFDISMRLSLEGIGAVLHARRRLHGDPRNRAGRSGCVVGQVQGRRSHRRRRPGRVGSGDGRGRLASR